MKEKLLEKKEYWNGAKNKSIRYYFYVTKGLDLHNPARYYVLLVLLAYKFLEVDFILLIPIIFIFGLIYLGIAGWLDVHHMAKVVEFLGIKYSTHFSKRNYEIQEEILSELQKLNKKIKE